MIFDISYKNKDVEKEINSLLGLPYGIIKSIRLGGTGSRRFIIKKASDKLQICLNPFADLNYSSLELRPEGIIVHISKGFQKFAWAIPYYKLNLYNSDFFSIHADGNFIQFRNDNYFRENRKFLNRLIQYKADYSRIYNNSFYDSN